MLLSIEMNSQKQAFLFLYINAHSLCIIGLHEDPQPCGERSSAGNAACTGTCEDSTDGQQTYAFGLPASSLYSLHKIL